HPARLDREASVPGKVIRTRLAKHREARSRAVVRVAVAQRLDARLDDMRWRREIGLTDLEVDHAPALLLERTGAGENLERGLCAGPAKACRKGGSDPLVAHPPRISRRLRRPGYRSALAEDDGT